MPPIPISQLIPVLQVAVGPVILISGVGLLLLTLGNRFGRAVDRSRQLAREMRELPPEDQARLAGQVEILYRRARLIRFSIASAIFSVLLVAVLITVLFVSTLMQLEVGPLIMVLFICCLMSLIAALGAFIHEVNLSLGALKLELEYEKPGIITRGR